ncbi:glycosyl transferase family 9 [Gandjariella thermophila]|uniref:glycosyl transferase family 9 n=1 Tax=Gandjariella thermophila TaxID=1931992 RepID=UPI0010F5CDA6|nr:glycosyl transferase family 9 [Gandjariella thermophila]
MPTQQDVIQWQVQDVRCHRGGRLVVPAEQAPFGRVLTYRRAAGQRPAPGCASLVRSRGWIADLGQCGSAELLLGLATVAALRELTPEVPLHYSGPQAALMRRCALPMESTRHAWGPHVVRTATRAPVRFRVDSAEPPTWLDAVEPGMVEVHAALPMRHYLATEQTLGERLARDATPAPLFPSAHQLKPGHVVLVTVPGWPRRLDFQVADFAAVAAELARARGAARHFTVITSRNVTGAEAFDGLPVDVLCEPDPADCVDLFASAELVIGADVGLTQLAALTSRTDGSGPCVVGLYSRHAHTKWITGSDRHHAVATRFAQMLALADRSADPAELDDATWGGAADLRNVSRTLVADFAAECAGW